MKQHNVIRQASAVFAAFGLALSVPVSSYAFTPVTTNTFTATVTVGGGATSMSVAVKNLNGTAATSVAWTAAVGDAWKLANQYLQVTSAMSQSNGAFIQTYTDNTLGTASPRYTATASSTASAGLVNSTTHASTLPMAWQINATTSPVAIDDPNLTGTGHTGWAWFYYADKAGGLMPNAPANSYIEPVQANTANPSVPAIQFAQGSFGGGAANGVNNLFLEALFTNAAGGTTYGTSTLTVELATP
jgi:hypothetical protein